MLTADEFEGVPPNIEAEDGPASVANSYVPTIHRPLPSELHHTHIDAGIAGGAVFVFVELCDGLAVE